MEEVIYYVVSFSLTIIGMLAGIAYWLGRKFAKIDMRFAEIDRTIAEMRRELERSIGEVRRDFERSIGEVRGELERSISGIREDFSRAIDGIKSAVVSANFLILDFMALKKLIERDEADFIKSEVERVTLMVRLNPLKKEERDFILSVVKKDLDDITVEEAERIAEIGKRWWYEDGCEEAYKIFLGGLVIRGYLISRKREGKKP